MPKPKLTPTQIKALKAAEAGDGFHFTGAPLNVWATKNGDGEISAATLKNLLSLHLFHKPRADVARLSDLGRGALKQIKDAEAAKEAAAKAKPLSAAEIDALRVALDSGGMLQCVISGTWSTAHGRTGSFSSRVINTLVRRCFFVKLDADTVSLTGDGEALAKIKESAR
jgi:hypothetical protein